MTLATNALQLTFETLSRSGIARLFSPLTQGLGVIFCMHRVQPVSGAAGTFDPNSNLSSTPAFLDAALTMLSASGYDFLSLDAAVDRIVQGQKGARPFAVFTLDDGYRDNLEHAMPVFVRHNCPFTVYVAPGFVDGSTEMWWMALAKIIDNGAGKNLAVDELKLTLGSSDASKWSAWRRLAPRVQALPELEQRDWIRVQAKTFGIDLKQMCVSEIMTWNEIRQMDAHSLATIGAHTLNHYAVSRLPEVVARGEIVDSGKRLERELGHPVRHFAFPYGNVGHAGSRDFKLCADAGYTTAVTTRIGTVFPEHVGYLHALPRVMVSGKYQEPRWLEVLAKGLPGWLKNRGGRLNVA